MKRLSKVFTAVAMAAGLICSAAAVSSAQAATTAGTSASPIKVFYYSLNDMFINQLSASLQDRALASNLKLAQYDANDDLMRQINQIQTALTINKDRTPILVNPVDTQNGTAALRAASQARTPVIFFNRKPADEALNSYQDAWYIGTNPSHAGYYQAEIVKEYFADHPEADLNKDGKISYVMLKGEPGHQDTTARTNVFVRTLLDAQIKLLPVASANANWSQARAQNEMANLIDRGLLDKVELIVANNDAMALGAVMALQAEGYNLPSDASGKKGKFIPVVGIDAIPAALDAVERGTMIGTVLNDYSSMADVMIRISEAYIKGNVVTSDLIGYQINNHTIEIPYVKVTNQNVNEVR